MFMKMKTRVGESRVIYRRRDNVRHTGQDITPFVKYEIPKKTRRTDSSDNKIVRQFQMRTDYPLSDLRNPCTFVYYESMK
jgi:hypothetical protein